MFSLAKQIELLNPADFETLVFHTLQRRYPGAGITKVNGSGGDKGIDAFAGQLSEKPAIWQAKAFTRLGNSQKKKILASFKAALILRPSRWTLCVPTDLRTVEHEWLQSAIIAPNLGKVDCHLMQGSNFVEYISADANLRSQFFPNDILSNAVSLRESAVSSYGLSVAQKERLSIATTQAYLDEYRKLDARFEPLALIGNRRNVKPNVISGSVFQIRNGDVQVDFVPENPAEYAADPIRISFSLSSEVSAQLSDAIDFGRPTKLPRGAILKLNSSSALVQYLFKDVDHTTAELELSPLLPDTRPLLLRVVAGDDPIQIAFDQLPFQFVRVGRKQLELQSMGSLPLKVSLLVPTNSTEAVTVNLSLNAENALITSYAQAVCFLELLETSKVLSVYACNSGQIMLHGGGNFSGALTLSEADKQLLRDVALIATTFNAPIRVPEVITRSDLKAVETLLYIVTGRAFGKGGTITSNFVKDSSISAQKDFLCGGKPTALRIFASTKFRQVELFGTYIDCGDVTVAIDSLRILNPRKVCTSYSKTPEGSLVDWKGTCLGPIRLLRGFQQPPSDEGLSMSVSE